MRRLSLTFLVLVLLPSAVSAQRARSRAAPTDHVTRSPMPRRAQAIGDGRGGFGGDLGTDDFFGYSVAPLGDLDGDGTPDIAVLEPGNGSSLWLLFLNRSGLVVDERELLVEGGSIDCLGDVDGDGVVDLGVGRASSTGPGTVTILFLNPDGSVKGQAQVDGTVGTASGTAGLFGVSVAGPGDVDGDGVPDLAVGTYYEVWTVLLNADGTVKARQEFSPGLGGFPDATVHGFGIGLDGLDDFDGDGVPDLLVGAQEWIFEGQIGHVWLVLLNADGTVKSTIEISSIDAGIWPIENECAIYYGDGNFGVGVTALGDLDGDGVTDIAVGAPEGTFACCEGTPSVWVLKLRADGSVRQKHEITGGSPPFELPLEPLDQFGFSLAAPGDIDGDGRADLLVGAPLSLGMPDMYCDYTTNAIGLVWLLFGVP